MSETTTISFEVPTKVLRSTEFSSSADEYRERADQSTFPRWVVTQLANAALVEARDALPRPRIPVTKNTPNGSRVKEVATGEFYWFIGADPQDEDGFYAADDYQNAHWLWWDHCEVVPE